MKRAATLIACTTVAFANASFATDRSYTTYADVIDVEPIVERRVTRQRSRVCSRADAYVRPARHAHSRVDRPYDSERHERRDHGPGAAIVGGILGGLIGHQFGGGRGKDLLTIGGAIAGAAIADRSAYGHRRSRHRAERCWMETHPQNVSSVQGYRVTYAYQGRTFSRVMDSHPGKLIPMTVQITDID